MAGGSKQKLKVELSLKWDHGNIYDATVSVTVTDSCYEPGDLKEGLPPGMVGIPEIQYLTFTFTHKSGTCSDIAKKISKTIQIASSPAKPKATAYAVVNREVVGEDTRAFPKAK